MKIDLIGKTEEEKRVQTHLKQFEAEAFKIIKQPYFLKLVLTFITISMSKFRDFSSPLRLQIFISSYILPIDKPIKYIFSPSVSRKSVKDCLR